MNAFCEQCQANTEVEAVDEAQPSDVFCLDCGSEFTIKDPVAEKYKNYAVAEVVEVTSIPKKDKLKIVRVHIGEEKHFQVVTNAKHVAVNERVVVACPGT
mmetsp:Transcript_11671/g.14146  ORF Transcript_11671/g.14146 Transcript_11671/m.14146 type:complete len:100 (+) Transcript_11671:56-355(+)